MPISALRTGIALGVAGIATATALDVAIDRTGHDHDSWAFRNGSAPTIALMATGAGAVAAGLGARLLPATRGASPALLRLGAAALGAWAATFAVRLGVGMLFSPLDGGMRWNPDDIAKNSIDRTHMMGRESLPHERVVFDWVSRAQGHGSLDQRTARDEFEPVWPR